MEQMLEELKREDAERAEDEARRRREEDARARAEELAQKKKAAENSALKKRKTAEKKARERQELEEQQAAKLAKELARKEKKEARRRKRTEEPVLTRPTKEDWELPEPTALDKLERHATKAVRWLRARQSEAILCVCFALFVAACIAEWLNPSNVLGLRNIYAVPINGPATADAAEWTCSSRGLLLVTHSTQCVALSPHSFPRPKLMIHRGAGTSRHARRWTPRGRTAAARRPSRPSRVRSAPTARTAPPRSAAATWPCGGRATRSRSRSTPRVSSPETRTASSAGTSPTAAT